jgi:hypothetical protein
MTRGSADEIVLPFKLNPDGQSKQGARERRKSPPSRLLPNRTKESAQNTTCAPCEGAIFSRLDRTKMFHVKLFCTIDPQDV